MSSMVSPSNVLLLSKQRVASHITATVKLRSPDASPWKLASEGSIPSNGKHQQQTITGGDHVYLHHRTGGSLNSLPALNDEYLFSNPPTNTGFLSKHASLTSGEALFLSKQSGRGGYLYGNSGHTSKKQSLGVFDFPDSHTHLKGNTTENHHRKHKSSTHNHQSDFNLIASDKPVNKYMYFNQPSHDLIDEFNMNLSSGSSNNLHNNQQLHHSLSKVQLNPQSLSSLHQRHHSHSNSNDRTEAPSSSTGGGSGGAATRHNNVKTRISSTDESDFERLTCGGGGGGPSPALSSNWQGNQPPSHQPPPHNKRLIPPNNYNFPTYSTIDKAKHSQPRMKPLNLDDLIPINESINGNTERSPLITNRTETSFIEQVKRVSSVSFSDSQPLYETPHSRSFIGTYKHRLVFVKQLIRSSISQVTQDSLRREYSASIENNKYECSRVKVFEFFTTSQHVYIISEYLHEESLAEILNTRGRFDSAKAAEILMAVFQSIDSESNPQRKIPNLHINNVFLKKSQAISFTPLAGGGDCDEPAAVKVRFSDQQTSYVAARTELLPQTTTANNHSVPEFQLIQQIAVIYYQLLCGVGHRSSEGSLPADFKELQSYLEANEVPRSVVEFLLKCLYIKTTTLVDVRRYLSKYLHRLHAAGMHSSIMATPQPNRHSSVIQQMINPHQGQMPSASKISPPNVAYNTSSQIPSSILDHRQIVPAFTEPFHDHSLHPAGSIMLEKQQSSSANLRRKNDQKTGSFLIEGSPSSGPKEKVILKSFTHVQGPSSFQVKLIHQKCTSFFVKGQSGGDTEEIKNLSEYETTHTVALFRSSPDEPQLSRSKQTLNQIAYNGGVYAWQIEREFDHIAYFNSEQRNTFADAQYLREGYQQMFNHKTVLARCLDKRTGTHYLVKAIKVTDDKEFKDALREIAIHKYIDHNIQTGLNMKKEEEEVNVSRTNNITVPQQSVYEVSRNLETQAAAAAAANPVSSGLDYLECLYRKADEEVKRQFEGGIQRMVDAYAVQRNDSNEYTFILVFEDAGFSLKDFILRNVSDLEDNPDSEEIKEEQFFVFVKVLAKQIKNLKRIGVFHNNIAPENILFQSLPNARKRILLANFEAALLSKGPQEEDGKAMLFKPSNSHATPKYKCPEVRRMMELGQLEKEGGGGGVTIDPIKSDVFSLGLCALELQLNMILVDSAVPEEIEAIHEDTLMGDLLLSMTDISASLRFSDDNILTFLKQAALQKQTILSVSPTSSSPFIFYEQQQQQQPMALLTRPRQLPSVQLQRKEQPEFKPIEVNGGRNYVRKQDLFHYMEKYLSSISETAGDLQLLYSGFCARRLFLFNAAFEVMNSLQPKYLKGKQRLTEYVKMEFLLTREIARFRADLLDAPRAEEYFIKALALQLRAFPDDLVAMADMQYSIASIMQYNELKNNNQMIHNLRSALQNEKVIFGNSSPKLVKILTMLGDEYAHKAQFMESLHYYQECMIITNALGYSGPQGTRLLDKLGWAFFRTSDYSSSLKFFNRSALVKERFYTQKDVSLAETYNNIGECHRILHQPLKAINFYEFSLSIVIDLLSRYQLEEKNNANQNMLLEIKAQVYSNLGIVYKQQGEGDKATKLFQHTHAMRSQLFGSSSLEATQCLYNIAIIYDDQGRHTEAMAIYDQIIQQFKLIKDLDNLVYADCLQNKAISHFHILDFAKALTLLNEAMAIKRKKAHNSVSLAITLQNLALVYHKQGQYKKALQFYEEALKIFNKKLKPGHPHTLTIQENMKQTQKFSR